VAADGRVGTPDGGPLPHLPVELRRRGLIGREAQAGAATRLPEPHRVDLAQDAGPYQLHGAVVVVLRMDLCAEL